MQRVVVFCLFCSACGGTVRSEEPLQTPTDETIEAAPSETTPDASLTGTSIEVPQSDASTSDPRFTVEDDLAAERLALSAELQTFARLYDALENEETSASERVSIRRQLAQLRPADPFAASVVRTCNRSFRQTDTVLELEAEGMRVYLAADERWGGVEDFPANVVSQIRRIHRRWRRAFEQLERDDSACRGCVAGMSVGMCFGDPASSGAGGALSEEEGEEDLAVRGDERRALNEAYPFGLEFGPSVLGPNERE